MMVCDRETEVRKLTVMDHYGLVQLLETGSAWKQVMARVRRTPTETLPCPVKYTTLHIQKVEEAGNQQRRPCAEIFLEEWGCSGRNRPTVADLLELLIEAELYAAADYVSVDLLKGTPPVRPVTGTAAVVIPPQPLLPSIAPSAPPVLNSVSESSNNYEDTLNTVLRIETEKESVRIAQQLETMPIEELKDFGTPKHIPYQDLHILTNSFNEFPLGEEDGRLLGKGAFGSVFLAIQGNQLTAVKRLNKDAVNIEKQFQNEVETLLRLQHPNLLRLIAYSCDGPENCLIYEYMSQGNLEERLSCRGRWEIPLSFTERIKIAFGTAEGIKHLHEYSDPPLVHRDVKSANILLGRDLIPKLGDFGLVHLGDHGDGRSSPSRATTVFGTSVYMAPETYDGDVSVKIDVFSFGVVMLELLTGLSPFNSDGDGSDLITHVNDICTKSTIGPLLDSKAGNWTSNVGIDLSKPLYILAQDCLEDKEIRPVMDLVQQRLRTVYDQI